MLLQGRRKRAGACQRRPYWSDHLRSTVASQKRKWELWHSLLKVDERNMLARYQLNDKVFPFSFVTPLKSPIWPPVVTLIWPPWATIKHIRDIKHHVWRFPQTHMTKISLAGVSRSRSERQVSIFTFWFNGKVLSILLVNYAVLKLNNTIYLIRFKLNNNIYLIRDTAGDWELNTK